MKKITIIIAIALFTGCSKDGSIANYEGKQSDLTGMWKLTSIIYGDIDITNKCYKKSTISVDSNGNATWTEFSQKDSDCEKSINNFIFKALNVNFNIQNNSKFNNYYGKFYSKNDIEIIVFFNDNNGLKSKTTYRFKN